MNDAEFADIFAAPEPEHVEQVAADIPDRAPQAQPAQQLVGVEQYRNIDYGMIAPGQPAQVNADPAHPQVQPARAREGYAYQHDAVQYGGVAGQVAAPNQDAGRAYRQAAGEVLARWAVPEQTKKPYKNKEYQMINDFGSHELVVHRQWALDQARKMMAAGLVKGDSADLLNQARAIESYLFRNKSDASNK